MVGFVRQETGARMVNLYTMRKLRIFGLILMLALGATALAWAQVHLSKPYFSGSTVYVDVSTADGEGTKEGTVYYQAKVYSGQSDDAGKCVWDTEGSKDYQVDSKDTLSLFNVSSDYSGKLCVVKLSYESSNGHSESYGPYRLQVP